MDEFLAEYYGTNAETSEEEIEAAAQLDMLAKEAAEQGIDLSQFSDDEIVAMAQELYGASEPSEEEIVKQAELEAQQKLAELDFAGRVMAHAMWHELGEIQKEAGIKDWAARQYGRTFGRVGRLAENAVLRRAARSVERAAARAEKSGLVAPDVDLAVRNAIDANRERAARIGKNVALGTAIATPLALAGAGTGGYLTYRHLKNRKGQAAQEELDKASFDAAFQEAVVQRAQEFLKLAAAEQAAEQAAKAGRLRSLYNWAKAHPYTATGAGIGGLGLAGGLGYGGYRLYRHYRPKAEPVQEETEKQSADLQLQAAIDQAALELLEAEGYL